MTSRTEDTVDQTSLQLMVDDLLCGKAVSSIDKKYHPLLVPYLQKAKNDAISKDNQGLEIKINRIVNQLTLSSPKQKKTPNKKQQSPKLSKTTPTSSFKAPVQKDYSEYDNEVNQLMTHKKSFQDIESKNFTPIKICIQQHRDEASKSQDYSEAKKYHTEYLSLNSYIKSLPKPKRHYGDEEYIDKLKYKYCEALQYYQDLKEKLNNEYDDLSKSEQEVTMKTLSTIKEENDEFKQKEVDIQNCKDFRPSSNLMNLKRSERKCAKLFMYDDAESRMKYSIELENREKNIYVYKKHYELLEKKIRVERERQKQNELTEDKNATKNELFQIKQKRKLRIAQAEIDAIKQKIEELGDHIPDETEMIIYSAQIRNNMSNRTKTSIKYNDSDRYASDANNQEFTAQGDDSFADSSFSQHSSQQNIKTTKKVSINPNVSSDDSTAINLDEDHSPRFPRSTNSSFIARVGTPISRSIADLTLTRRTKSNDNENQQNNIIRDKSIEYDFVFEENEEEEKERTISSENLTKKGQITKGQKSNIQKTKEGTINNKNLLLNNNDDDSIFLSDSTESELRSEETEKRKRNSLSYKKYLTPDPEVKKTREKLEYGKFLRSPKPKTAVVISDHSYSSTSNNNTPVKAESTATEIIYSSIIESSASKEPSEYSKYYYSNERESEAKNQKLLDEDDEEEEYQYQYEYESVAEEENVNEEYSYNYITEDEIDSYG